MPISDAELDYSGGIYGPLRQYGPVYDGTHPAIGMVPGASGDQGAAMNVAMALISDRGGGTLLLPPEWKGVGGPYVAQSIAPRSNVGVVGLPGATKIQLPAGASAHLFDNQGLANVSNFRLQGLILDGGGTALGKSAVRMKRAGSSDYAWDGGGIFDVQVFNAGIGIEVDWAGDVYCERSLVKDCTTGLRLEREHLYLNDVKVWGCPTGIYAVQLLHTHWDHVVIAHGGYTDGVAVLTPATGGPHFQESRLVNGEVIDYSRGFDARYLIDCEVSGWRMKSIRREGLRLAFSGSNIFSHLRLLNCGDDAAAPGTYSAMLVTGSASLAANQYIGNLARDQKASPTMRYGFDLIDGAADTADGVIGYGNHVRNPVTAGYRVRPNNTKFAEANNIGTRVTV